MNKYGYLVILSLFFPAYNCVAYTLIADISLGNATLLSNFSFVTSACFYSSNILSLSVLHSSLRNSCSLFRIDSYGVSVAVTFSCNATLVLCIQLTMALLCLSGVVSICNDAGLLFSEYSLTFFYLLHTIIYPCCFAVDGEPTVQPDGFASLFPYVMLLFDLIVKSTASLCRFSTTVQHSLCFVLRLLGEKVYCCFLLLHHFL